MAKHRIRFVKLFHAASDFLDVEAKFLRKFGLLGAFVRNELVERRIDQANSDGQAVHRFEDTGEVAALKREKFVECLDAGLWFIRKNHFLNGTLAFGALLRELEVGEEHMLGTAEPDAFSAHLPGFA